MIKKTITIVVIFVWMLVPAHGQLRDQIFDDNIHTLQIHPFENPLSAPIASLQNLEGALELTFDDFRDEVQNYYYKIIHCDYLWNPSENLSVSEYISGFNESPITEYLFSQNTLQQYIHYRLVFPKEEMMPKISGNYMILIYLHEHEYSPIAQARFMVCDFQAEIIPKLKPASAPSKRTQYQEIDFDIEIRNTAIINPTQSIRTVVQQNMRYDNQITDLRPKNIDRNRLIYDYEDKNLFLGGNNFRAFDLSSLQLVNDRVGKITIHNDRYHALIIQDESRQKKPYILHKDIHGQYLIRVLEYHNSSSESDYVYTHFTLGAKTPYHGSVYLLGHFNRWEKNDDNKMTYNYNMSRYEIVQYVKQGHYDYIYVYDEENCTPEDSQRIENSYVETNNLYTILVYYLRPGDDYYQLIGVKSQTIY